jgi:hypothetical protein
MRLQMTASINPNPIRWAYHAVEILADVQDCIARWAPIPVRTIVGYGFVEHRFAKLLRGPGRDLFTDLISRSPIARWAPVPLRLIVGYGFMEHGFAKLARGPDAFPAILHAIGVPAPHLMGWPRPSSHATPSVDYRGAAGANGAIALVDARANGRDPT